MRTRDVTPVLKALGWKAYTDEVGDKYTHYELSDRVVEIIYSVRRVLTIRIFERCFPCQRTLFQSLTSALITKRGLTLLSSSLGKGWISALLKSSKIMSARRRRRRLHGRRAGFGGGLQKHAALPTTAPGTGPVLHLAALAVLRDVTKLKSYQASWAAGDRLGFVPYVTKDYIDRAVSLAEEFVTGA